MQQVMFDSENEIAVNHLQFSSNSSSRVTVEIQTKEIHVLPNV